VPAWEKKKKHWKAYSTTMRNGDLFGTLLNVDPAFDSLRSD